MATILVLMASAFAAPHWLRAPDLDESRTLAPAPHWPQTWSGLRPFRKAADAYVADHFPSRPHLIGALNRLRLLVGVSGSPKVIIGREGWLYYNDGSIMAPARGIPPWTEDQTRNWLHSLAGRTEYLKAQGVPYLVVVPPVKEAIYPQYAPGWFKLDPDRPAVRVARLARQTGAGEVLYLYDPIVQATARGAKTYGLHDTHWDGPGAYAGYVGLMTRLHAMGLTEGPRPFSDFALVREHEVNKPRNMALMLGVASFVHIDFPEYDDIPAEALAQTSYLTGRQDWTAPHVIETGQTGKPVMLMTMDSFSNALMPFLLSHFSRIVVAHTQDGAWRPDLIARFKPDVVLLEVLESGLSFVIEPAPPPSPEAAKRIDTVVTAFYAKRRPPPPALAPPTARQAKAIAAAKLTDNCNIELSGLSRDPQGEVQLKISGWLSELARTNTDPVGLVRLEGGGRDFTASIRVDLKRPDVAAVYKVPAAAESGFSGEFRLPGKPAGSYSASVYRRAGGGWIACRGRNPLVAP